MLQTALVVAANLKKARSSQYRCPFAMPAPVVAGVVLEAAAGRVAPVGLEGPAAQVARREPADPVVQVARQSTSGLAVPAVRPVTLAAKELSGDLKLYI